MERLGTAAVRRALARLVSWHGEEWGQALFTCWTERETWRGPPEWLPALADICEELCAGDEPPGAGLAAWLLDREVARAHERCVAAQRRRGAWLDLSAFSHEAVTIVQVLTAAARLGDHELVAKEAHALAAQESGFPLLLRLAVLREGLAQPQSCATCSSNRSSLTAWSTSSASWCRNLLATRTTGASSTRSAAPAKTAPSCCDSSARRSRRSTGPLNKERRRHIHGVIDAHDLPVSHETRRTGRPYVLQLRKQRSLFGREASYWKALRKVLGELELARGTR